MTAPAGVTDPTPGNNSATDSDTLAASADLAITKTDGVTTATPGGSVTYTITASNAGPEQRHGRHGGRHLPGLADLHLDLRRSRAAAPARPPARATSTTPSTCRAAAASPTRRAAPSRRRPPARSSNTATVTAPGRRHRSDPGQQLGDRQRHAGRQRRSGDHQDRRRDHGDPGRLGDLHHHRQQRRTQQRHRRHGGRHLPGLADLHLDLRRRGRRHLHGLRLGQHQRHRQPAERRQRDLHGELHHLGGGHRHARATRRR